MSRYGGSSVITDFEARSRKDIVNYVALAVRRYLDYRLYHQTTQDRMQAIAQIEAHGQKMHKCAPLKIWLTRHPEIDRSSLDNILRGRSCNLAHLITIANALDVPLYCLLPLRNISISDAQMLLHDIDKRDITTLAANPSAPPRRLDEILKSTRNYIDQRKHSCNAIATAVGTSYDRVRALLRDGRGSYVLLVQVLDVIGADIADVLAPCMSAYDHAVMRAHLALQSHLPANARYF